MSENFNVIRGASERPLCTFWGYACLGGVLEVAARLAYRLLVLRKLLICWSVFAEEMLCGSVDTALPILSAHECIPR